MLYRIGSIARAPLPLAQGTLALFARTLRVFAMCWKDHYIDLILSYPSIPLTEQPQYDIGRYLPSASHGIGCYLTYPSHFRPSSSRSSSSSSSRSSSSS
eukprot:7583853-Pyramimonas_sp.AAC.1